MPQYGRIHSRADIDLHVYNLRRWSSYGRHPWLHSINRIQLRQSGGRCNQAPSLVFAPRALELEEILRAHSLDLKDAQSS